MRRITFHVSLSLLFLAGVVDSSRAAPVAEPQDVRKLSSDVLTKEQQKQAGNTVSRDIRRRRDLANAQNRAEWDQIKTRQQWEQYRDVHLARLRKSLGTIPSASEKVRSLVTSTIEGDGYRIENLVYESRPGQWVTANLYVPAKLTSSMPGILIQSSHHRDKWQGELQDMGMTWARHGCMVLAIDEVGYGERRAHPFHGAKDYDKEYQAWRQDYYFRYDSGIQLQLAGESLMGWFVTDLMHGVDLLLSRPGIDPKRIILLGAVAGGGDPCAVTAALDKRITGAVPFNFGGAQPETRYPLPKNAEMTFNYLGGSYWDSTRGLRRGGADGFFHWTIVGSIAPRPLIYAHEFAWDKERDPVWKRFEILWGEFYEQPNRLAGVSGKGSVRGRPPESTHCTNVGKYHRQFIHPLFKKWFAIDVKPEGEYSKRLANKELTCWTPKARAELKPVGFVERASRLGQERSEAAQKELAKLSLKQRRRQLQQDWRELLGPIEAEHPPKAISRKRTFKNGISIERIVLEVEPDVIVPTLLLAKWKSEEKPRSVVIAFAQGGKDKFLTQRADEIATLIDKNVMVCLPDVRGTGETKSGTARDRTSGDGDRSVRMLLFEQTMLGQRLRDLRSVMSYLRTRGDVTKRFALWGDSFASVNSAQTSFKVPHGVNGRRPQSEPLGGLLALLAGLYEEDVQAIYVHGGLSRYHSVLNAPYVLIPHDVVVPNVLTKGDLSDVAAALAPRPLRLDGLVDGLNRRLAETEVMKDQQSVLKSYASTNAKNVLAITTEHVDVAEWLLGHLRME